MKSPEPVKCLVWDLDHTVWAGTLLESDACRLRPGVRSVVAELDRRGILQSVASRNDPDLALPLLARKRLDRYFLEPRVGWESKVRSLEAIGGALGVSLDSLALIDDEPFEREQVEKLLPGVRSYPAAATRVLTELPEFSPAVTSLESRSRRATYQGIAARSAAGVASAMSQSEFLGWCQTEVTLRRAREPDLPRILELLGRTHQLNATGEMWPPEAVRGWMGDPRWRVYVAVMRDRFADYGRIGVAACRVSPDHWELVVFLLSCRVLSRGISGFFLSWIRGQAFHGGASTLRARFRPGDRNHHMRSLFQLSGLTAKGGKRGATRIFSGPTAPAADSPRWLTVHEEVA